MTNVPPPLLGFNNNVRHRGRIFHIQTEDSGVKSPRIVTHLFADGGRIINTTRTEYAEHVARPDVQPFVRGLMKEQHKAMFMALRMGELDTLLEQVCGPFEQPLQLSKAPPPPALSGPPSSNAPVAVSVTEPAPAPEFERPVIGSAFGENVRIAERSRSSARERLPLTPAQPNSDAPGPPPARPLYTSNPPPRQLRPNPPAAEANAPPSLSRPSSRFAAAPTKTSQSIFGDGLISEQSLDEVILSYLAEDVDGSRE